MALALQDAVFPAGGRIRPKLVLAVGGACRRGRTPVLEATAVAIELLHCASLVHDDLPCFDDASTRRGRPSVQRAYGAPMAVLVGDALIVAAFETLAVGCRRSPAMLPRLIRALSGGVGAARGIMAGQAWELERSLDLEAYHQAKTGALFEAATRAGAIAGGGDEEAWAVFGQTLGEAYQVADDIADVIGNSASLGKPVGQDAGLDRPSAVRSLGISGANDRLEQLLTRLDDSIPPCPDRRGFRIWAEGLCARVLPSLRPVARVEAPTVSPARVEGPAAVPLIGALATA